MCSYSSFCSDKINRSIRLVKYIVSNILFKSIAQPYVYGTIQNFQSPVIKAYSKSGHPNFECLVIEACLDASISRQNNVRLSKYPSIECLDIESLIFYASKARHKNVRILKHPDIELSGNRSMSFDASIHRCPESGVPPYPDGWKQTKYLGKLDTRVVKFYNIGAWICEKQGRGTNEREGGKNVKVATILPLPQNEDFKAHRSERNFLKCIYCCWCWCCCWCCCCCCCCCHCRCCYFGYGCRCCCYCCVFCRCCCRWCCYLGNGCWCCCYCCFFLLL